MSYPVISQSGDDTGVVLCSIKKSWQKLEGSSTTEILLFQNSDNLIPSDNGSSECYMEYVQKNNTIPMKWFCQKCDVSHPPRNQNIQCVQKVAVHL
jgi:hypothetical protein